MDAAGRPHTDTGGPPEFLSPRHRLVLGLGVLSAGLLALLAALAVLCLALGARIGAALFALATVLASPLLLLGPVQDWWRFRRGRRRMHRQRPQGFGG